MAKARVKKSTEQIPIQPQSAELHMPLTACSDKLPDTRGGFLTSDSLVFIVDGKPYAGHYHCNGWFYEITGIPGSVSIMAAGHPGALGWLEPVPSSGQLVASRLIATYWAYLRRPSCVMYTYPWPLL